MYTRLLTFFLLVILSSCSLFKKSSDPVVTEVVELDTLEVKEPSPRQPYKASATRIVDQIHAKLDVKFDWEKEYLYGKANLTFTPYFYDVDRFKIDAKGFEINEVSLVYDDDQSPLDFNYEDSLQLEIILHETYTSGDTIEIYIEYTAKPNELNIKGSSAISDAKGLYFINADGSDPDKPQQIWTQGEPESNSAWFPCIDKPNEKITQEISITVEEKYVTLSNGILEFSSLNGDGTRTDHWIQETEHPPYLVMMTVGEYAVIEDKWRDSLDLYYYVEPEYEPYAKLIFGDTPEMLDFFSDLLDYEYPWDKYAQVVVRDYVSGAMENTGAVIFGEFAQVDSREILDQNPEDVIAHELAHHWFGNIVTCESWANLPLNESFAAYSEYLWREYKHGRANADMHLNDKLSAYLSEFNRGKAENLIRFYHSDPGDMFDRHSYDKGARVLHMLRKYVGDDAFFAAINHYLVENEYKPVEIHHLRLAFEEVIGEDFNWFFNQWFLDKSHPKLEISYDYNDSLNIQTIYVEQIQDFEQSPVYKLPVEVDFYFDNEIETHEIVIDSVTQTFSFEFSKQPKLVNVDAEKMLLAEKKDLKTIDEFVYQYHNAPLFIDKLEALEGLGKHIRKNTTAAETIISALNDSVPGIREKAVNSVKRIPSEHNTEVIEILKKLVQDDPESTVRASAVSRLTGFQDSTEFIPVFKEALNDSSYFVNIAGLEALYESDPKVALTEAEKLENTKNSALAVTIAVIYLGNEVRDKNEFFLGLNNRIEGFERVSYFDMLSKYASKSSDYDFRDQALQMLSSEVSKDVMWFLKLYAVQGITNIRSAYHDELDGIQSEYKKDEDYNETDAELIKYINKKLDVIESIMENLKENVDDPRVQMMLE